MVPVQLNPSSALEVPSANRLPIGASRGTTSVGICIVVVREPEHVAIDGADHNVTAASTIHGTQRNTLDGSFIFDFLIGRRRLQSILQSRVAVLSRRQGAAM